VARWLEEDAPRERPFYLQMGFFETHRFGWLGFGHGIDAAKGVTVPPYLQEEISARQEFAAFQADVRAFDEGVGQILDGLDRAGLREQTLLVDVELYDLRADPHEQANVASSEQHQSTRDSLMAELYDWMVETDDPLLYGIPTPPSHTRALSALRDAKQG
jgi:hypothetical protein